MKAFWMAWIALPLLAATGRENPDWPRVTLRVYDLTGMSTSDLAAALGETTKVLQKAGIALAWTTGDPTAPEAHWEDATPRTMPVPLPRIVVARIMDKTGQGFPSEMLGRAYPFANVGCQITIFLDHIRIRQAEAGVAVPNLMGHVLAHELGHVLLRSGSGAHTPRGLMSTDWGRAEFQRIEQGALNFSQKQAAVMRSMLASTGR